MYYAHINDNNEILGWYTPTVHQTIPEPHIQADVATWQQALASSANVYNPKTQRFECQDLRTKEQISAENANAQRQIRDKLLYQLDLIVSNPLRFAQFNTEQTAALADYRQALLDVPQQAGFPEHTQFPKVPDFIA